MSMSMSISTLCIVALGLVTCSCHRGERPAGGERKLGRVQ